MLDGLRINGVQNGRQYVLKPDFKAGAVAFYEGSAATSPRCWRRSSGMRQSRTILTPAFCPSRHISYRLFLTAYTNPQTPESHTISNEICTAARPVSDLMAVFYPCA